MLTYIINKCIIQNIKKEKDYANWEGGCVMDKLLRGFDVVLVDFGNDIIGSEQGGIRPACIIQNNQGNTYGSTTLVMPFTKQFKNIYQPTHTLIKKGKSKGLVHDSVILGECLRQVSEKRIKKYLGKISDIEEKKSIKRAYDANFVNEEVF